ncbi:MAG: response regulator [Calditrichaeota bacterium]|nr:MAG: response regulator [Calditrichota bacterium]MBL1205077.1 response regulator [Calditrichota bacterium]NOG44907.1 response regulator [Calditrichota bacterium]
MEKVNIICIDDQREVLAAVQKDLVMFEPMAEIIECESSEEAEEVLEDLYAEEKPVAMIISDHIMPDENGVEFLARMQKDDRFKKVSSILLTGLATHQDTIEAINRARISHYIEKPWKAEDLQNKIKALLTHFILASGRDYTDYQEFMDQDVIIQEMRNRV